MIDWSLRECPFCGNPAEIVDAVPPEWHSGAKHKRIVCSSKYCVPLRETNAFRFCVEDYCNTYEFAAYRWNERHGKNPNTWNARKESEKE